MCEREREREREKLVGLVPEENRLAFVYIGMRYGFYSSTYFLHRICSAVNDPIINLCCCCWCIHFLQGTCLVVIDPAVFCLLLFSGS